MSIPADPKPPKRPYSAPHLICFGDIKQATMGASIGVGDSLDPFTRKSDSFGPPKPR